jgi:hypothetical protein
VLAVVEVLVIQPTVVEVQVAVANLELLVRQTLVVAVAVSQLAHHVEGLLVVQV